MRSLRSRGHRRRRRREAAGIAVIAVGAVLITACGDDGPAASGDPTSATADGSTVAGVTVAAGLRVGLLADGFEGPTQFVVLPDGDLVVGELNGGERDGTGRVVLVDRGDVRERTVLVDGLVAPTGVAVSKGQLWIMEQRRLTSGPLEDPSDRTVVLDELPFNGRSEGSLTALASGGVLFDTSGSRDADQPAALRPGSGTLWSIASPGDDPSVVATGFKHAYAHVVDADGRLWSTEMSDGRLDGEVPPDELVNVQPDDDFGYPRCVGDRVPVIELGATDESCSASPRSHALFEPGATPTSVAVAPWAPDVLVVALWNRGEIVAVPRSADGRPHVPEVLVAGLGAPQHLAVDGDALIVTDFATGRILTISRA